MNLSSLFDHSQNLPNIPKVVQELIQTFNQSDFDMDEIAKKISLDPVLTAKVLRLANCAHYGVSRTISSTTDASVLLGFSTLRTLVLASGITGAMLLAPQEAKKIQAAVEAGGKLASVENSMLGYTYADVGAELAKRWKFPDEIAEGILYHCNEDLANLEQPLAGLLHLALYVHNCHKMGFTAQEILNDFPLDIANAIGMDTDKALSDLENVDGIESGMDTLLEDIA